MAFQSSVVQLEWRENHLVLRRGASSLVINPEHVQQLRISTEEPAFFDYFMNTALQNREARRVFEAWKRKDPELLFKIYKEATAS